jgi:protein-S-isoprenylcysteine O-methyltransferase Ste14
MKGQMSRWGVGPGFALLSIGYGMVALAASRYSHPAFQIGLVPYWPMTGLGIALIFVGGSFFIASATALTHAYNAGALVTDGVFRCCRHPVYSSWVVLIVPGIVLLVGSWIGLTVPLFMYFLLRRLVKKEETYLEGVFGAEYVEYARTVPCILPVGWLRQSHGKAESADAKSPAAD